MDLGKILFYFVKRDLHPQSLYFKIFLPNNRFKQVKALTDEQDKVYTS